MELPLSVRRVVSRVYGRPLVQNSFRGELVEEIVAMALEPEWEGCGEDWASCDLVRKADGLRIQVKQSAARQSWHTNSGTASRPSFSIAPKTGRWERSKWIEEAGRNADIFVFGWHPIDDESADHRDPEQWQFYVIAERDLPQQKSIGLSALSRTIDPVRFSELRGRVNLVAAC